MDYEVMGQMVNISPFASLHMVGIMPRESILKILTCSILFLILFGVVKPISAHRVGSTSIENTLDASLVILSVEYADADGEDYENDIVGRFNVLLNGAEKYNLNVTVSLTLPSGLGYRYSFNIIGCLTTLHCSIYMYDHAIEPGDYIFSLELQVHSTGTVYVTAEYIFDPPEGSGDADPCVYLVF